MFALNFTKSRPREPTGIDVNSRNNQTQAREIPIQPVQQQYGNKSSNSADRNMSEVIS